MKFYIFLFYSVYKLTAKNGSKCKNPIDDAFVYFNMIVMLPLVFFSFLITILLGFRDWQLLLVVCILPTIGYILNYIFFKNNISVKKNITNWDNQKIANSRLYGALFSLIFLSLLPYIILTLVVVIS